MLAYSVAEIMRIILSVYTEWRNATPGGRLAPSLGNRKQMLSSRPAPPAALLSLPLSLHLSTVLISKQLKGSRCENTLGLWHTEPGAKIYKQACPQKPGAGVWWVGGWRLLATKPSFAVLI